MMTRRFLRVLGLLGIGLLGSISADAQSVWVSDQFEVMLRTGPDTENAIEEVLNSGTELEVLQQDAETGYSRVQTQAGTVGWVLTRFLMQEPGARDQLATLSSRLTSASERAASLAAQLDTVRREQQESASQIQRLEKARDDVQAELEEFRRTSANVIAIDNQNQILQQQVTGFEIQVEALETENEGLSNEWQRNWFIVGALVLFAGVLVGLILPRMGWRKRSRYDSF